MKILIEEAKRLSDRLVHLENAEPVESLTPAQAKERLQLGGIAWTFRRHCANNLPRLLAAIRAERAAFSKTNFEIHAVPEGSTDEWMSARKETDAAIKKAEEIST